MDRRGFTAGCLAAAGHWFFSSRLQADDVEAPSPSTGHYNAVTPTLGGKQFWADELFFHDWHIQRNAFTGHYRLLDGYHLRHAWGSFDDCSTKLEQIKQQKKLPPMQGPAAVVLHGLFRTASAMNGLNRYLRDVGGYTIINVGYPSTRGTVAEHAQGLKRIIDRLDGIDQIDFVGHSLGNLVVRHYLGDCAASKDPLAEAGIASESDTASEAGTASESHTGPDKRIKRMVMLGPPNQGAELAEALGRVGMFHTVAGASASQLAGQWQALSERLATPAFEFGILAGGRGNESGYNPWLTGDNDLVVSVETTRLGGATDFSVVPAMHTFLMDSGLAQEYTLRFLKHGYFVSTDKRQPIAVPPPGQLAARPRGSAGSRARGATAVSAGRGRIAGIDYGTVRIGIAISDVEQTLASPLETYTRRGDAQDRERFRRLATEERVARFVVGLPVHLDGRESEKSAEARRFGVWLHETTGVEVVYFDERFTSYEAEQYLAGAKLTKKKRKERLDKLAAQIMLSAYLERVRAGGDASEPSPRGLDD